MNYNLLIDFYQLTMAQNLWLLDNHSQRSVFHLSFRSAPFGSGYVIFCGINDALEIIKGYQFEQSDLDYLASMKDQNNQIIFQEKFLNFLKNFSFSCDIHSFSEGSIAFAAEPVVRVEGTFLECLLLESILLNNINFQSLIATKASRLFNASESKPVLELGLRRAQGKNGALTATKAAYIGGCHSTSNTLAGKIYGIPVIGTHSHSWVVSFESEKQAFRKLVSCSPERFTFLIDSYSILRGIENAITVAKEQKNPIDKFFAVRIDSGDIAYFSKIIRKKLDKAGFFNTKIIASNDLDEHIISSLNQQKAKVDIWGVGTKLVTAKDDPVINGVYKLSAIQRKKNWDYCIKISEDIEKINIPGVLQVARFFKKKHYQGDVIFNEIGSNWDKNIAMVNHTNPLQQKEFSTKQPYKLQLKLVMRQGEICHSLPNIHQARRQVILQLQNLDSSIKRLVNPHAYPTGLEVSLFETMQKLILQKKEKK
jgi:nicotinate phosphoribosyltransferase